VVIRILAHGGQLASLQLCLCEEENQLRKGLAAFLVRAALEHARQNRRRIILRCSYVARFVAQHSEFAGLLNRPDISWNMNVHWLQHVQFEGLGAIEPWLLARGHHLSCTRFFAGETPPGNLDAIDWLVVMGGPMNVYQHRDHPWLPSETRLIREAILAGKRVFGVCLGAQLIADALGGKVFQNGEREIGWFPVRGVSSGASSPFVFPAETVVFHWHGDTFSLPPGSTWLARSEGCAHQAFSVGTRVLGLQFHLEMSAAEIRRIAKDCADELSPGRYIQSADDMVAYSAASGEPGTIKLLDQLLSALERGCD
jgi:GMP synthase-like glutamine amidotransferase